MLYELGIREKFFVSTANSAFFCSTTTGDALGRVETRNKVQVNNAAISDTFN